MARNGVRFALFLAVLTISTTLGFAQLPVPGPVQPPRRSEQEAKMEREQGRQRNEERHRNLKRDTDHLLELATQLKQYVDKSNENVLSVDVVRKAAEIEKLARSVKDKMKGY